MIGNIFFRHFVQDREIVKPGASSQTRGRMIRTKWRRERKKIQIELTYYQFFRRIPVHSEGRGSRLNCRIPCHFEAAPLKRLDTRIRSRKYHPSPGKLLTILRSGYADTRIRSGKHGYPDTWIRGHHTWELDTNFV